MDGRDWCFYNTRKLRRKWQPRRVSERNCSTVEAKWTGDWWSDGTGTLRKERLLRIEGELTLPSVCDDLFAWSSLL